MLLSVLDHHTRRQEGAGRVIGTLLGRRDGDKVSGIADLLLLRDGGRGRDCGLRLVHWCWRTSQ